MPSTSHSHVRRRLVGALVSALAAIALVGVATIAPASATSSVTRTPWQMHIDPSPYGNLGYTLGTHGEISAYDRATVPAANAGSWTSAPNPETIGFGHDNASRLRGYGCLQAVDFTYFQTFVTLPVDVVVNQFSVNFSGIDDGARISVYNATYPDGLVIPGSYVFLGGSGTTNLASYLVTGVNRVVITQMDDCAVGNNLRVAQIVVNDTVIPQNTPPSVAVTGVAAGASYEIGSVPAAGCAATDTQDGPSSPAAAVSPPGDGLGSHTATCSYTDAGGLSASASATYTVVDTGLPTLSGAPTTAPNANDWYAGPVTIAWASADGGSGIDPATDPADSVITGDGAGLTASASVSDLAGNAVSAVSAPPVNIDTVAPTASPVADATGWSNEDVTVTWGWSDGLSGTDDCDTSSTSSGEGAAVVLSSTCTDLAGNSTTATYTVAVDKTDPVITFTGPASYGLLDTVGITCSATDALSGIAESTCEEASGAAWTFTPGTHDLDASATDNAGNESSAGTSFTVTATPSSVCGLVGVFTTHNGTRTSLCAHIANFERSRARGQSGPAAVQLEAFRKEATSRIGKQLTATQVSHLIAWANSL